MLLVSGARAQVLVPNEPVFTIYGMDDGLSHASVRALVQDRDGFLWVGTQHGLNRFDGLDFRVDLHDVNDTLSLSDDFILALARAEDGQIWVGTQRGGLNRFDPRSRRAQAFELSELGPWRRDAPDDPSDRRGRTISDIVVMADSSLILASDLGALHFDPRTGEAKRLASGAASPPDSVRVCGLDGRRALIGAADGTVSMVELPGDPIGVVARVDGPVTAIRCASAGTLTWVGTDDGHVIALDEAFVPARSFRVNANAGERTRIQSIIEDAHGDVWVGTAHGLFLKSGDREARRVGNVGDGALPSDQVISLLVDTTGVLWIGTWNGLASLHPLVMTMTRVPRRSRDTPGIAGNGVIAIEGDGEDRFWIGANAGGVQLLQREHGRSGNVYISRPAALGWLAQSRVYGLAMDGDRTLWVATDDYGVIRFDTNRSSTRRVPIVDTRGRSVSDVRATSVFVSRSGEVWAGSRSLGLLRFDPGSGSFRPFRGPSGGWDFGSQYIWPIIEDHSSALWVGAYNGGVTRIDASRRTHQFFGAGSGLLSDDRILTLFEDSHNLIWIGTEGGGLNRLDPETGRFTTYTAAHDLLPNDNIEAITEDASGYLWISTSDGIARFEPGSGRRRIFRRSAGLAGNRFFANSVMRDSRGEIFFGGDNGLTILDPKRLAGEAIPPRVELTGFEIQGKEHSLAEALDPRGLVLHPDQNFFTFRFAELDFRDPTRNAYRYRLGPEDAWNPSGTRPVANYTAVAPARYMFRVEARDEDGAWRDGGLSIRVRVLPPFYQTWWFRSLLVAALLSLVSGFYLYRLRQIEARQSLRLSLAGRLHDDIGANLSAIALKADMLENTPSLDTKRRTQLNDVARLAREAAHKVRETVWVVNSQYDTLTGLVTKMRDATDTLLQGQIVYHFVAPDHLPDRSIGMELRQNTYLVFKESLHNVLKHAHATQVEIEVRVDGHFLSLTVRDNGRGFDPAAIRQGNGLGLMRQRAERHGAEFEFSAPPDGGAMVFFRVALK